MVFCLCLPVSEFQVFTFPKCKFGWLSVTFRVTTFSFKFWGFCLFVCFFPQYQSFSVTVILHSDMNIFRVAFGQLYKVKLTHLACTETFVYLNMFCQRNTF